MTFSSGSAAQKKGTPTPAPPRPPNVKLGSRRPVSRSLLIGTSIHGIQSTGTPSTSKVEFVSLP